MAWTDIDDRPSLIRPLLAERGLALKKRWGQNFMISRRDRERVVALAAIESPDRVWEIGSGLGGITELLVTQAREVTVFEVDFGLARVIEERFGERVRMVHGDAAKTVRNESLPDRIVGNLPYRSAAAIVSALLERDGGLSGVKRMVYTVQKEMAVRMGASPGTREYSPFSVLCQLAARVSLGGDIPRGSFYPAPEVASSIVILEPQATEGHLLASASTVTRALFQSRRKTIANNLPTLAARTGHSVEDLRKLLAEESIDSSARAEELGPQQFAGLAAAITVLTGDGTGQRG